MSAAGTGNVLAEAARRRTFAVISHPDAGKSTMTEALALHAQVIGEAGAVHGKGGRRGRGVRLDGDGARTRHLDHLGRAPVRVPGLVINLLDTPGHADFSEDTYRVLAAVDCAVMLLDAAKGLEPQTLKLFEVCRHRGIPVITFVNKWDRPGREPLALLDEIEQRIGLRPTPITWPVGIAGEFHGVVDRAHRGVTRFTRTPGGATAAIEERARRRAGRRAAGRRLGQRAQEELTCSTLTGAEHDQEPSWPARPRPCCSARRCQLRRPAAA